MSLENLLKRLTSEAAQEAKVTPAEPGFSLDACLAKFSDEDYLKKIKSKKKNDLISLGIDFGISHARGKTTAALFELVNFICVDAIDIGSGIHDTQECIRTHTSILGQHPHDYWLDEGPGAFNRSAWKCIELCQNEKWRETFFRAALAFSGAYADWLDVRDITSHPARKTKAALYNSGLMSWDTYHRYWLNSFWGELDSAILDFITAYTHITPVYCEYMPEGSSFYVFPEAKKK